MSEDDYVLIEAEQLSYDDSLGTAIYEEDASLKFAEGWLRAGRIEILLDGESRQIREVRAFEQVTLEITEAGSAQVTGATTGQADRLHDRVFTQFGSFASVRDLDWHYFQHHTGRNPGAGPCLYNLKTDPTETKNTAADHPDRVAELRDHLATRLAHKLPERVPPGA